MRVSLPDPVTDSGVRVVNRPIELEVMMVTFPPNPFNPATVIVEAPVELMFVEMEVGVAEREKSTAAMMKVEV